MYKNMTYQQAKRIRSQSISSVLADQLIMGAGYGAAIKQTASAKWNAKIAGIKEKFDPLNIAKFLTGGSRLGPAILGKMLGRSRKDIEYFTGRARPVQYRGPKIPGVPAAGTGGDNAGMVSVLNNILTFLQKEHDSDMDRREKENNLREGQKHEDERRHQELMKALGGIKPTKTATKVKKREEPGDSLFGNIFNSVVKYVDDLIAKYKPMLDELSAFMKQSLWPIMRSGLSFFASSFGPVLIPVIAGALFKLWWDEYRGQKAKDNVQKAQEQGGSVAADAERKMNTLREEGNYVDAFGNYTAEAEAAGQERDDSINRRLVFKEDFLKHSGFKKKKKLFGGTTYEDNSGKQPSADMMKAADQFAEEQTQKIFTGEVPDPLNKFKAPAPKPENKQTTTPADAKPAAAASPVVPSPASAEVTAKTQENRNLALAAKTAPTKTVTNNTNVTTKKTKFERYVTMPSVRNMEDTFQRLIYNSTIVV